MLKPLGERVLVRPAKSDEKTSGGIILPDTAQKKPQEGVVLAVGTGRQLKDGARVPPEVKVGDTIIYSKWAGTEVKIGGEVLLLLDEDQILAIR